MDLCELDEQEIPLVCSQMAEETRNKAAKGRIDKILDHHLFDIEEALESELRAWELWERVNAGK